jgi:hypothetical protein
MKLGMHMETEPISAVYFIHSFHRSVCLYVYSPIVARQRLRKIVTAARNMHATEELLKASFSRRPVSCQLKGDNSSQNLLFFVKNRDSSVGIATGYGLDGRGVRVRAPEGSRIFSSLALGSTQLPVVWVLGFFLWG